MDDSIASDDLTMILSAPQLVAMLSRESISAAETRNNLLYGGLKIVGGTLEIVGAAGMCAIPEPFSKAGCVLFGVQGIDTVVAGAREIWTGRDTATLMETGIVYLAERAGLSTSTGENIAFGVSLIGPGAPAAAARAIRFGAIRAGVPRLLRQEGVPNGIIGGHTISRHVGKTQAELRDRLAKKRKLDVASSYHSLEIAAVTVFRVMNRKSALVKSWLRSAPPRNTLTLTLEMGEVIGASVTRNTGKYKACTEAVVVLKDGVYNGMPFYVLTSYVR